MLVLVTRSVSLLIISLSLILCVLAADEQYIIYPVDGIGQKASDALASLITQLAGGENNVYTSLRSRQTIPNSWTATLSDSAFQRIRDQENVQDIHINGIVAQLFSTNTSLFADTTLSATASYETQALALPELRVLSQPPGTDIDNFSNYVYRSDGSNEAYIYHAELGINSAHVDFRQREIEWVYTGYATFLGQDTPNESPVAGGHSTCTASKAAGDIYGAAKNATLVVVKMPNFTEQSVTEIMSNIIDHIETKGRQGKSVVTISWGSGPDTGYGPSPRFWQDLHDDCRTLLLQLDVHIVAAAGNSAQETAGPGRGKRTVVDTAPAIFAGSPVRYFGMTLPILVVGNCYTNGLRYKDSQTLYGFAYDQLYAPGVDVQCASGTSTTASGIWTGTSFSAPLVAGVIANLMRTGQLSAGVRFWQYLYDHASWKRHNGELVIWNTVDEAHNPPKRLLANTSLLNLTSASWNDTLTE